MYVFGRKDDLLIIYQEACLGGRTRVEVFQLMGLRLMNMMFVSELGSSGLIDAGWFPCRAAAIPRGKGGARLQMKLSYDHLAPLFLFLLQWMDYSCTCLLPRYLDLFHIIIYKVYSDGRPKRATKWRKASIRDFYAVILPSLRRLQRDLQMEDLKNVMTKHLTMESGCSKKVDGDLKLVNIDLKREDECGICLEPCSKMVLPNCCHAMCINCYRNWNVKSESCPFCRGSLKRVKSEDLWVLTCHDDVVDNETVSKEDLLRFYLYINSLPKDGPDALFLVYYEYLI